MVFNRLEESQDGEWGGGGQREFQSLSNKVQPVEGIVEGKVVFNGVEVCRDDGNGFRFAGNFSPAPKCRRQKK